jgi:hypothetical protein
MLYAGSLVFSPPAPRVELRDWSQWWTFLKGADWHHPYGPAATSKDWTIIIRLCTNVRIPPKVIKGGSRSRAG